MSTTTDSEPAFVLSIAHPGMWITLNKGQNGEHWSVTRKKKDLWREYTHYAWHQQGRPRAMPPCVVRSTFVVHQNRTRDPHNFVPTLKPVIDQLVDDGVWPDDNPIWVRVPEPAFQVVKKAVSPMGLILRCYPFEVN